MKFAAKISGALVAGLLTAGAALASGPVIIVDDVLPPPPAPDWTGFYAGLSANFGGGHTNYFNGGVFNNGPYDLVGVMPGIVAGYNHQSGNFVFGVEIAAMNGEFSDTIAQFQSVHGVVDAKLRAGISTGPALIYGTLGYSTIRFTESYADPVHANLTGPGIGVGVNVKNDEGLVLGGELYARRMNGNLTYAVPGWTLENSFLTTVSVFVGKLW